MTKDETVTQGLAALEQSVKDQLGAAYDAGLASAPAGTDDGINQGTVDAAVAAQRAADAKSLVDAQAQLTAVQATLTDMTGKELAEESVVTGLQASVAAVQSYLDQIKALLPPAPPVAV